MSFGRFPDGGGIEVVAKLTEALSNFWSLPLLPKLIGRLCGGGSGAVAGGSSTWPKSSANALVVSRCSWWTTGSEGRADCMMNCLLG